MTQSAPTESRRAIESYLASLRKQLWQLTSDDANDIIEEIRMHILDKTGEDASAQTVATTIAALGTPAELANKYCSEEMLRRGRAARSPAFIARSSARLALLAVGGLTVFALSVVGYSAGGLLVLAGLDKTIDPSLGFWGTWTDHEKSWSIQSGSGPHPGHELLGWWLVPIGLIAGGTLLLLTFRLDTWWLRKFWRPRRLQQDSAAI